MALELPEAVTIAGQLDAEIKGKKIKRAWVNEKESAKQLKSGMINLAPREFEKKLSGRTVDSVSAHGRMIYTDLGEDLYFIIAFETNGKVLYHTDQASVPEKFNTRFDFEDDSALTVHMIGWAAASVITADRIKEHKYLSLDYGSPLDESFTFEAFNQLLEEYSGKQIKPTLTQQGDVISGIGTGYIQDILFKARIHPKRKVKDITESERAKLYEVIKRTLSEAVKLGGRDIHSDIYDKPGRYVPVLGKHMVDRPCPECGTKIEKVNAAGSASFVCPVCQK